MIQMCVKLDAPTDVLRQIFMLVDPCSMFEVGETVCEDGENV